MKRIKGILIFVMCFAMLIPSMGVQASAGGPKIGLVNSKEDVYIATYGQPIDIKFKVENTGSKAASNVKIAPVISTDPAMFPFEIKETNYERPISNQLDPNGSAEILYNFITRGDVSNGYIQVDFKVTYTEEDASGTISSETILPIFVKTEGAPPAPAPQPEPIIPAEPQPEKPVSVPRVIISGFKTEPEVVKAGDSFKLTLHIKNTSNTTSVNNLEFDLQAAVEGTDAETTSPAFLPLAGSSTIYVDKIAKNSTKDISIEMNTKADLAQKPYVINVSMKYEDGNVNQYTSESSVSIPVKQEARVEVSEPQIMPNSIEIGSESNVMFSVYNTGKVKLYNVSVAFEGDTVTGGESFVGNIEPGATGNVDVMLLGQSPTMDNGIIKILVTYEDETGAQTVVEKEMELFVNEGFIDEEFPNEMPGDMIPEDQETGSAFPVITIVIIILVIIGAGVAVILIKRKKKKEEGMEDEIS